MLAIFVIAQDRGGLLDLVIVGRPHLGLVSRAIPLQSLTNPDLFVIGLIDITRLRFLNPEIVALLHSNLAGIHLLTQWWLLGSQ